MHFIVQDSFGTSASHGVLRMTAQRITSSKFYTHKKRLQSLAVFFSSPNGNGIAPNFEGLVSKFFEDCKKIHEFKRIYEAELEKPGSVLIPEVYIKKRNNRKRK